MIALYVNNLQEAYLWLRRRYRPGVRKAGGKPSEWERLARRLYDRGFDPYEYVQFVFDVLAPRQKDVPVRQLAAPTYVYEFAKVRTQRKEDLRVVVRLQVKELEFRLSLGDSIQAVLKDPEAQLSAVFRYAVAVHRGFEDIVKLYAKDAQRMLMFKPYYKELLGSLLKEGYCGAGRTQL